MDEVAEVKSSFTSAELAARLDPVPVIPLHYTVSLHLCGSETSTNAANYYTAGLKGRWQETRRRDDHRLTEDSVRLARPRSDGTWEDEELSALLALNLDLRDEYIADCETGVKRWNKILDE